MWVSEWVCVCVCLCEWVPDEAYPQNRKEWSIDIRNGDARFSWIINISHKLMWAPLPQEVYIHIAYGYFCRLPTPTCLWIRGTLYILSLYVRVPTGFILLNCVLKILLTDNICYFMEEEWKLYQFAKRHRARLYDVQLLSTPTVRDSALRPQKLGNCSGSVNWINLARIPYRVAKLGL
jgi:hypothetical protein